MKFNELYADIIAENSFKTLAAAGLLAMSPMQDVVAASKPVASHVETEPRGFRNNNPGNIEKGGDAWKGAIGNDGRFLKFKDMTHGVRAMARILRTYQNKYDLSTVRGIISRWAPPKENPTEKYIAYVVNHMSGVSSDTEKLDLSENTTLFELIQAIIKFENGKELDELHIVNGIMAEPE